MSKQSQHVLIALPHPLLHLVSLGLVSFIFTLFSLELSQFGTQLAPLWFPTSIMMVAFYRHAGRMWAGNCAELLAGKYRRIHPAFFHQLAEHDLDDHQYC